MNLVAVFAFIFCSICINVLNCQNIEPQHTTYRGSSDVEATDRSHYSNSIVCANLKPQQMVDIEQIMGMWYGIEIIMHTPDAPGVYEYQSCVIAHLSDISDQMQIYNNNNYRRTYNTQQSDYQNQQQNHQQNSYENNIPTKYLRLIWSEKDDNLEYTFNYTHYNPGLWTNIGEQRGSLESLHHYTQFEGTVQVVKAVHDHMVLTFCDTNAKGSIYSLVLSRAAEGLNSEELRSIRKLLSTRGLYPETIRKVCTSAALGLKDSAGIIMLLLVISNMFAKNY